MDAAAALGMAPAYARGPADPLRQRGLLGEAAGPDLRTGRAGADESDAFAQGEAVTS
jgi:hypothetical protein